MCGLVRTFIFIISLPRLCTNIKGNIEHSDQPVHGTGWSKCSMVPMVKGTFAWYPVRLSTSSKEQSTHCYGENKYTTMI